MKICFKLNWLFPVFSSLHLFEQKNKGNRNLFFKLLKNAQTIFPFNRENARMTFFESSSHVACEGEVHAAGEKPFKSYAF